MFGWGEKWEDERWGEGKRKGNGVDVVFLLGPLFLALSKLGRKWWGKWPWEGNYKISTSIFHHSTYNYNGIVIISYQFPINSFTFPSSFPNTHDGNYNYFLSIQNFPSSKSIRA